MLGALLGVIGPPAVGKSLNSILGLIDRAGESQERRDAQNHEREMAQTKEGRAYLNDLHKRDENGEESLLSVTMCRLYLMFGGTMCAFILFCLLLQYVALEEGLGQDYAVPIKDPDEKGKTISFFGIGFNWGTGKIQNISPLGMGYLAYASISFIITLTLTNRRRFR
jgi:hypothetical protein